MRVPRISVNALPFFYVDLKFSVKLHEMSLNLVEHHNTQQLFLHHPTKKIKTKNENKAK